ncbi:MAG: excinuclease ABC subunit UvrC, partial [Nocardioides sp.]
MPDPRTYRPKPGEIPTDPGVYRFRDAKGRVIYVGKAKSLRPRLTSYFQDIINLHPRTATMVTTAASVEWTVVNTEVEALALEYSWIKEYDPRFNVKYRDDKSYPWLAVTLSDEFPRVMVGRGAKRKGTRYFGPYGHAWAIRETVDVLLRVFPMRSCSNGVFKRSQQIGRPCLLGYIDKCSAPCVGKISPEDHRAIVQDFCDFMGGQTAGFLRRIEKEMYAASDELDFERAARLRDDLGAMNRALEKQAVVLGDGADADVIALAEDPLEVGVQIFYVRGGRIKGQRGWVADRVEEGETPELVEHFLLQLYVGEDAEAIPREILVPALPPDVVTMETLLSDVRGAKVSIKVPQRGDKKTLQETVATNAKQALALHKTKRASDLTTRNRALEEIRDALDMEEAPLRIECYDISHLQGTEIVASMVVFEDGLARKSEYRRFIIKGQDGSDDVKAMHEVITRRFRRLLDEQATSVADPEGGPMLVDPETGRPRKFAYAPGLVVVDGGAPQVAAAVRALDELGIDDIPVVGLAKRL